MALLSLFFTVSGAELADKKADVCIIIELLAHNWKSLNSAWIIESIWTTPHPMRALLRLLGPQRAQQDVSLRIQQWWD